MNARPGLSRRDFVAAGALCAAVAGVGGLGAVAKQANATPLRPPGCASEEDFLALCDRCQRCVQVCPYAIVQPMPFSRRFLEVGTPELVFKTGFCDFCMKCMEVCPTGALRTSAATSENIGVAKVVSDACVAWEWAGCTVCVDECPVEGAMHIDEHGRPVVKEDLCNGCGKCEAICPAASLRAYNAATLERGIYVVPRDSVAAQVSGALTSNQVRAGCAVGAKEHALQGGW